MRSTANRILHALVFEAAGLALTTPLGAFVLGKPLHEVGVVTVFATVVATVWTYFYNLIFDHTLLRLRGTPEKTGALRILHAGLFEAGLLLAVVPFFAWYLGIGLIEALILDIGFAGFYLVYALVFNWIWERAFPYRLPQTGAGTVANG